MNRAAFLTMAGIEAFECYDHLLYKPLKKIGWDVTPVPWRKSPVDWDQYDVVIIRSPWDYQQDPERFMDVLESIDRSEARLENSLDIVRWNIDKTYLQDMEDAGIPIVPTLWKKNLEPGEIPAFFDTLDTNEIIIKPVVSANADDTFRIDPSLSSEEKNKLSHIFTNRAFMVQPFAQEIVTEGEFSLFYFGGDYSHTILKTPTQGDFRVQEEHGGRLQQVDPEPELMDLSNKTMQALPELPLYARVDFVRSEKNEFELMELELIEPSLYFNMDPESPERFAHVFNKWMKNRK